MQFMTSSQAKQKFGDLLEAIEYDDVTLTSHDRPIAIVTSPKREQKQPIQPLAETKKQIIRQFFNGEISRQEAVYLCDYDWYGELLDDAERFGIPVPKLPEEVIEAQVVSLLEFLAEHDD